MRRWWQRKTEGETKCGVAPSAYQDSQAQSLAEREAGRPAVVEGNEGVFGWGDVCMTCHSGCNRRAWQSALGVKKQLTNRGKVCGLVMDLWVFAADDDDGVAP